VPGPTSLPGNSSSSTPPSTMPIDPPSPAIAMSAGVPETVDPPNPATAPAAAAMTVFPEAIRKALAIPAASGSGSIKDVEHIVVFMQENRSFDHYFGHLRGVRGYNDRF